MIFLKTKIEIGEIRELYAKMNDAQLEYNAKYKANKLRPEVIEIIKEEITKRGLGEKFLTVVENQQKEFTPEELEEYVSLIEKSSCPKCDLQFEKVNASKVHKVRSFIFMTSSDSNLYIACNTCISKEKNKQLILNLLLGWWGLPWGIIKTPIAISNHFIENANRRENGIQLLILFIKENTSELYLRKDEPSKLTNYLRRINDY